MHSFLKSRTFYRPYLCYFRENPQKSLAAEPLTQVFHGLDG
jgi:hypothetical protein